ncbi:MAG: hypothetical protein KGO81_01135 [Bacteroidota bacterium]|nr:hypothetical protein [Bacteroidota bacterium]
MLGEGTIVYRPVLSYKIKDNIYRVGGTDFYNPDLEKWEFTPDTIVFVEKKILEGEQVLVAVRKI